MDERNRLVELIHEFVPDLLVPCGDACDDCKTGCVGKLTDHLLANGVIVPPCKIGDPIYRVCSPKGVRQQPSVRKFNLTWNNLRKTLEDFGTLVFLTEKKAERVANGREKAD